LHVNLLITFAGAHNLHFKSGRMMFPEGQAHVLTLHLKVVMQVQREVPEPLAVAYIESSQFKQEY